MALAKHAGYADDLTIAGTRRPKIQTGSTGIDVFAADGTTKLGVVQGVTSTVLTNYPLGSGVYDLAAARTAAGDGGRVFVPAGVHEVAGFTSSDNAKPLNLAGVGWSTRNSDAFGAPQWLAAGAVRGSVLKYTGTGTAFDIQTFTPTITDVAFLGPGTAGTTALKLTSASIATIRNVGILNFAVGLDMDDTFSCVLNGLYVGSCTTGIDILNCNALAFTGLKLRANGTAMTMSGDTNSILGGTIEGNTGATVVTLAGQNHTVNGVYFENYSPAGSTDLLVNAHRSTISGNHWGGSPNALATSTGIRVVGVGNHLISNDPPETVVIDGASAVLIGRFPTFEPTFNAAPSLYVNTVGNGNGGVGGRLRATEFFGPPPTGTTAQRPTLTANTNRGFPYWDTTVGGLVLWNGTAWAAVGGGTTPATATITGDGSTTTFTVTHNLGLASPFQPSSGTVLTPAGKLTDLSAYDIDTLAANSFRVVFAVAPANGAVHRFRITA